MARRDERASAATAGVFTPPMQRAEWLWSKEISKPGDGFFPPRTLRFRRPYRLIKQSRLYVSAFLPLPAPGMIEGVGSTRANSYKHDFPRRAIIRKQPRWSKDGEKRYDAIVVGSGACGGWAARWRLSKAGMKVLMLEAGSKRGPGAGFSSPVSFTKWSFAGKNRPGALRALHTAPRATYRIMLDNTENP